MSVERTVDAFLSAIERGDVDTISKIYHDKVEVWHNFSNAIQEKKVNIALLAATMKLGALKYTIHERQIVGDRVIQRHELTIKGHSGRVWKIPVAMFITVREDQIVRIDEYVDTAQLEGLVGR